MFTEFDSDQIIAQLVDHALSLLYEYRKACMTGNWAEQMNNALAFATFIVDQDRLDTLWDTRLRGTDVC
jgi:hypothetical protein